MTRFAVFGDSFVSRLEKSMSRTTAYRFFGKSGMSTRRKIDEKLCQLLEFQPDVVFMNVGGNDIRSTTSIEELVKQIKSLVAYLQSSGVRRVYVASIVERGSFPSFTGLSKSKFNKIRRSVNKKLQKHFGKDFIDVGGDLRYPRHYDRDMVHPGLREGGMQIFRTVIERCFDACLLS